MDSLRRTRSNEWWRRLIAGSEYSNPRERSYSFVSHWLVTPVKPLDRAHWGQRYYHIFGAPGKCSTMWKQRIINVHIRK